MYKFLFYDPYASLFAEEDPHQFVESNGTVIFDSLAVDWEDASVQNHDFMGLLELGALAVKHLDDVTSRPRWDQARADFESILRDQRAMLGEVSRSSGLRYVSPMGKFYDPGFVPDWNKASDPEVIGAISTITRMANDAGLRASPDDSKLYRQQFAYAALEAIDSAILGVRFADAGGTINPVIVATKCLANAESLLQGRGSIMSFAKQQGAKGGKASRQIYEAPREFVQTEWVAHRDEYKDNKSDFARTYVKLVIQRFGVEVTEKTIRETWLAEKDTPPSG